MVYYYAELRENIIQGFHVVADDVVKVGKKLNETAGSELLASLYGGTPSNYMMCAPDDDFRGKHVSVGYTYDPEQDWFVPVKPYPSWVFNQNSWTWEAPVTRPLDGVYFWDEEAGDWVEVPSV